MCRILLAVEVLDKTYTIAFFEYPFKYETRLEIFNRNHYSNYGGYIEFILMFMMQKKAEEYHGWNVSSINAKIMYRA